MIPCPTTLSSFESAPKRVTHAVSRAKARAFSSTILLLTTHVSLQDGGT